MRKTGSGWTPECPSGFSGAPAGAPAPADPSNRDFPIAAIGASAGGLDAFLRLVKAIPPDLRISFVILQHLSPGQESILPQILARNSRMPVQEAVDKAPLEPGRIYVMPPSTTMVLEGDRLRLHPREGVGRQMPVDIFLRSLAKDQPHRAIAIILSGAGTDGSLGMEEVKASGGITFAQDPKSAKFDSMPHSAMMTGSVDYVLTPEDMAEELVRICRDTPVLPATFLENEEAPAPEDGETRAVLGMLTQATGVDFAQYKPNTVRRRITRRMMINRCASLGEYVDRLRHNTMEVQALGEDILIQVTRFFRDAEAFEALKKGILPGILRDRSAEAPVRIWVPGCSTGEEVYSLAISLLECLGEDSAKVRIQLFGTDVSEEALAKARGGVYLENIALDVSPERLRRFFHRTGSYYQIKESIRDMCVFARQDVTRDHPFSRIDLITCRNLLIYLGASLQKRVFPTFHYALKPTGYLMLGASETVGAFSDLFHPVDARNRIFSRTLTPTRYPLPVSASFPQPERSLRTAKPPTEPAWTGKEVQREADRLMLAGYSPPGVVVNGNLDILQFRGHTGAYLEPASGHATLNLLRMARPRILADLRKTMDRAKRSGMGARSDGIQVEVDGRPRRLDIEAIPLNSPIGEETYYLVLFHDMPPSSPADPGPERKSKAAARKAEVDNRDSKLLRMELEAAKDYLESVIAKQDATNEELKSANEEILSSNEELQSINEELETAKEELQSTNEELITLNEELQNRNLELNLANNDLSRARNFAEGMIRTVRIPLAVLDREGRIKTANRAYMKGPALGEAEVQGRSIHDLGFRGRPIPGLRDLLAGIRPGGKEMDLRDREIDLRGEDGDLTLLLNASALELPDERDGNILVTLEDITGRKRAEREIRRLNDKLEDKVREMTEAFQRLEREMVERRHTEEALHRTVDEMEAFSYTVSHDLRAPLRAIQGIAEALLEDYGPRLDATGQDYAQRIVAAGQRMDTLIQDLLAYGRMARNEVELRPCSLDHVVEEALAQLSRDIRESGASVTVAMPLGKVLGNFTLLSTVVLNLLSNALKFRVPDRKPQVEVRTERVGSRLRLWVEDNGIGIDPEHHKTIFRVFERLHGIETYPGNGIGLAIVHKGTEHLGGEVGVESAPGRGSRFRVDLIPGEEGPA